MVNDETPLPIGNPDVVVKLLRARLRERDLELPVTGSSMRGVIDSGSIVTVTAANNPRLGEVWAFAADEGQIVVHRIRHLGLETATPRGIGNPVDDRPVSRSRLIGRVKSARGRIGISRFETKDRIAADFAFRVRAIARRAGLDRPRLG